MMVLRTVIECCATGGDRVAIGRADPPDPELVLIALYDKDTPTEEGWDLYLTRGEASDLAIAILGAIA
jgi:hypothetical protein